MKYKLLGRSGLRVSELCLGTMTFGEDWGWGASRQESCRIFEAFAEAGGNFIDTSNNYTNGTSEKFVGEFTASDRECFVIATKYSLSTRTDDPNAGGNHRKNMIQAIEASLKRLNTSYIDLFWLHMWDGMTPVEEVMRALDDLVRSGKVLYAGFSDTPAWVVAQANTLAGLRGWSACVGVQLEYSLASRTAEGELLPMARGLDLAVLAWGVLEGGELTGKYNSPTSEPKRSNQASEKNKALASVLAEVAAEVERTPSQVAINWVRQQNNPYHAPIIPILGARTEVQIKDNLACLEFELTPKQLQRLNQASPVSLGFPQTFLNSSHVHSLIFGETYPRIDNHRQ